MIKKPLQDVTIEDIKALKENAVPESVTLDYKKELPLNRDEEKAEFLYDISSFANSQGGDIVFGVAESDKGAYPESCDGFRIDDTDEFLRKVFSIVRDGIEPRILRIDQKLILVEDQRYIFIIRLDRSLNRPHMVVFRGRDRFYAREANGKFRLNVTQLRALFNATANLRTNLLNFRRQRVQEIVSNNGFVPLLPNGKIILHVIPISAFDESVHYDLDKLKSKEELMRPLGDRAPSVRYNFDGLLSCVRRGPEERADYAYLQFFRNGVIETVDSYICQPSREGGKELRIDYIEHFIVQVTNRIAEIYDLLKIPVPAAMMLTIVGISDFTLRTRRLLWSSEETAGIDPLYFPELLVESWNVDVPILLKPWFDALWNAFGYHGSHNFKNGEWNLSH